MKEIIEKRIEENEKLFTCEEIKHINDNFDLIIKIYLLGTLDIVNL